MSRLTVLHNGRKIGTIPASARNVVAKIARLRGIKVAGGKRSNPKRRRRNARRRPRKLKFGSPAWRKKYLRHK